MSDGLVDRHCVVTGASSGIGRAVAIALAERGARLLLAARSNVDGLQETLKQIEATSPYRATHETTCCDVSEATACEHLVERAWQWQTRIDAWIHCAGADVLTGANRELSFEQKLDLLWRTDVLGTIRVAQAAAQRMKQQPHDATHPAPLIVTIGWDQTAHGMAGEAGMMFGPVKGAVAAFTLSLARTVAPEVRAVCVAPGWIQTAWGAQTSDYWETRAKRESLLARWGKPKDVAQTIAFLASDGGAFFNGQVVPVNGGFRHEYDPGT